MRTIGVAALLLLTLHPARALEADEVIGTWKLVSSTRKVLDTSEEINTYGGAHPTGWITYGREGRVTAIVAYEGRTKPASIDKLTDPERISLFKTFFAYSGTYTLDGNSVTHHIDTSWNEVWTGTSQVRDIEKRGDTLIYTTRPAPFSGDGKMSIITLVWQKVP
ncbi:lipocalin-like domain-containing protein [Methylobacterium sp. Leaf118]|uniref:lipocalin-like domain-containing protein n=1 Tax=Methylobacterium sp. Leaf118 TaxID=2876562 RepID=UPI001E5DA46B|nr:lipocalin-like domain-containing protein [Methylobacterium sp. Leaf118]